MSTVAVEVTISTSTPDPSNAAALSKSGPPFRREITTDEEDPDRTGHTVLVIRIKRSQIYTGVDGMDSRAGYPVVIDNRTAPPRVTT